MRLVGAPHRIRYQPGTASDTSLSKLARLSFYATAPLGGSRLVFPARLARTIRKASRPPGAASIPSAHARRFFGRALILWTDPGRLTHRLHDRVLAGKREIRLAERFIDAADWADVITPIDDLPEHRETLELARFRDHYPEMPAFRAMLQRISSGRAVSRYRVRIDSEEKLHQYFRFFLALIQSIEARGFQEQRALRRLPELRGEEVRGRFAMQRQHEIGVAIGPDGRLLRFLGGRHRTAIAQALGIAAVPVEIRLVHADWLSDQVRRTGLHPVDALRDWIARTASPPEPADAGGAESSGSLL